MVVERGWRDIEAVMRRCHSEISMPSVVIA